MQQSNKDNVTLWDRLAVVDSSSLTAVGPSLMAAVGSIVGTGCVCGA